VASSPGDRSSSQAPPRLPPDTAPAAVGRARRPSRPPAEAAAQRRSPPPPSAASAPRGPSPSPRRRTPPAPEAAASRRRWTASPRRGQTKPFRRGGGGGVREIQKGNGTGCWDGKMCVPRLGFSGFGKKREARARGTRAKRDTAERVKGEAPVEKVAEQVTDIFVWSSLGHMGSRETAATIGPSPCRDDSNSNYSAPVTSKRPKVRSLKMFIICSTHFPPRYRRWLYASL
jgi:hypothetical protein